MHATLLIELKYLRFFAENLIIRLDYRMGNEKANDVHTQKIFLHNANYNGKTELMPSSLHILVTSFLVFSSL